MARTKPQGIPQWWWNVVTKNSKFAQTEEVDKAFIRLYWQRKKDGRLVEDRRLYDLNHGSSSGATSRPQDVRNKKSAVSDELPPGWTKSYTELTTNGRQIMKLTHVDGRTARSIKEAWRIHNGEE